MTPNITSARQAIQALLSHARQGAAFYSARVEALETALTQLESVDTDDAVLLDQDERRPRTKAGTKKGAGKRGRPARNATAADNGSRKAANDASRQRAKRRQKPVAKAQEGNLPTTGADFWLELVTDEPRSAVDIANAAAAHLGLGAAEKTQIQKLKQRVAPALATLVTAQKIQHAGTGRQRRYFKDSGNQAGE